MLKNLKKVISTIAAVAILATSASAFAVTFPDVDESATYAGSVELLTSLGIVSGDENGKFNPDNAVTRAEFAKMVVESLGKGEAASKSTYTRFADAQGHWGAGYIEAGVAAEFINGYDDGTFKPNNTVTYAEAVKMLVGAAGYESWAQMAGGWTAGYMSYASSLGITAGVTGVTNDTELSRAQCAILIANALKAPLLVIDGYYFEGTMNGVVQVPNYVQMDETGEYWQTMLTEYHNAYDVKGRVTATSKQGACKKDEVMFAVEDARNIDDVYVEDGNWIVNGQQQQYTANAVKFGSTNANNMMFEYASAVLVKDDDTNEYTIAYIEPYGATKTVEFPAESVRTITAAAANVLKSEMTSDTKAYDLKTGGADIYVNGYRLADIQNGDTVLQQVVSYIADNNKAGTVTLVDESVAGSTVTDGKYDAIMITYTWSGKVLTTRATSTANRIDAETIGRIAYDPEDEDVTVKFVKNGAEIAFEDIKEDDVVTVSTSPYANFTDLDAAVIEVTDSTVAGTVTKKTTDEVTVDGVVYPIAAGVTADLSKEYTFFLDANGVIVSSDVIATNINYGIVTKYSWNDTKDAPQVVMITAAGEEVVYTVKDESANDLAVQLKGQGTTAPTATNTSVWTYSDVVANPADAVISYKLTGGKLVVDTQTYGLTALGSGNLEYKENAGKLGAYAIDDTTSKIIDISAYLADKDDAAVVMSAEDFQDEFEYTAYVFDKNTDTSAYQFVLVTRGTNSLRPTSDLAIVKQYVGDTKVGADEEEVKEYIVAVDGEEKSLFVSGGSQMTEGSIIMYPASSKAYVLSTNIETVFAITAANDTYAELFNTATTANTEIFDNFAGSVLTKDAYTVGGEQANTLTVPGAAVDQDVRMYIGVVAKGDMSKIDVIEDVDANRKSNVDNARTITITGANAYTFDYNKTADKGYRLEVAGTTASIGVMDAITNQNGATDDLVDWALALNPAYEAYAPIVIVREIDGDATDVFYFIAE